MADTRIISTYQTSRMRTTPYPNRLLEATYRMSETELRITNYVVRNTLGWHGGIPGTRKASVDATRKSMMAEVGIENSTHFVDGIDRLIKRGILLVRSSNGSAITKRRQLVNLDTYSLQITVEYVMQ